MGAFVISKRFNGDYKFVFASRRGKTIFTSVGCKSKLVCEEMIAEVRANWQGFAVTKQKTAAGKYSFRLSREGLVLANSRKYTTELRLQKGIDEIIRDVAAAEVLDFSEGEAIFPDADSIFLDRDDV